MATSSRGVRRSEKLFAAVSKQRGAGAQATGTKTAANLGLKEALIGAALGFVTGGPGGAVAGGLAGLTQGGGGAAAGFGSADVCRPGTIRIGNSCVDPRAGLPGGAPFVTPQTGTQLGGGGQAVIGAFGLPARAPVIFAREQRECGPGMVLGKDNLCYPKQVLQRRSSFRKWRQPARPKFTAADIKAINRAETLRDDVKALNKAVGLKVPTQRVSKKKKK